MSMSVSSQDQPFQLFSCRWAWCRLTFSDNTGLVNHVLHDHIRHAIPVRRRDISVIKRAEEGKGESFDISELMVDMYSYTSRETISQKPIEHPQEPSLSLPSPPASSPASSPHHLVHSPRPASSLNPLSLEGGLSQRELSQHAEEYPTSDPISQTQSESLSDGHHHLENLPVMSPPPYRLQINPSAAVRLSSPSPVSSPIFAVSTPLRQNGYQPPLKRKSSTCYDKDIGFLQTTPGPSSEESRVKDAIVDALPANRQSNLPTPPTHPRSPCNSFSQSSQDLSELSEISSYPALQTQAPYQSQILTQF